MAEQAGQVQQVALNRQQLAALPWFESDLRRLAYLGAVEWREGGAALAVGGLRPWLMENVVAGNRYAVDFPAWRGERSQNLLTAQEMKTLRNSSWINCLPSARWSLVRSAKLGTFKIN